MTRTSSAAPHEALDASLASFLAGFDEFLYFPSIRWGHTWERQQTVISAFAEAHADRRGRVFPPLGIIPHSPLRLATWKKIRRMVQERLATRRALPDGRQDYPLPQNLELVGGPFIPGIGRWRTTANLALSPAFRPLRRPRGRRLLLSFYATDLVLAFAEKADFVVLDLAERRQANPLLPPRAKELERALAARADILVADNRATLADYADARAGRTRGFYLPQGFNPTAPVDGRTGHRPDGPFAYLGNLHHAIDYAWLRRLAEAHPGRTVRLCGSVMHPRAQSVLGLPNVDYWGRIAHRDIPKFLEGVSWGLIPYAVTDWTAGVFPTKLFEYLDCGVPVLSTAIPEVAQFGGRGFVHVLDDPSAPLPSAVLDGISDFLHEHTWNARMTAYGRLLAESAR